MAKGGYKGSSPARETSPEEYSGVWDIVEQYGEQKAGNWPFQADDNAPKSLRFDRSSGAYLAKTPTAAGNRRVFTFSCWYKRTKFGTREQIISAAGSTNTYLEFQNDQLMFEDYTPGANILVKTNRVFRDPSAFYSIVLSVDTTSSVASDRVKIFVNGVQETSLATANYGSQNYQTSFNSTGEHKIGQFPGNTNFQLDGLLSDVYLIDGQALSCEEFGFFDGQGIWQPKRFTGDYSSGPVYSNFLTSSGTFDSANPPTGAFDGIADSTSRARGGTDDILTFDISSFGFTGLFEFWSQNSNAEFSIDGGSTWSAVGDDVWTTASTDITGVTSIKFRPDSGATMKVSAFRSQGQLLIDAPVGYNSFHLDFSDGAKDQSGLGNDWTPNNITLRGDGTIYSNSLTSTATFSANNPASYGFDGSIAGPNVPYVSGSAAEIVWTPPGGYNYSEKIELYVGGVSGFRWNLNGGGWNTATVNSWNTVAVGSGTITTLKVDRNGSATHGWHAIKIDNQILVDGQYPDFFVDSPVNGNEASTGAGGERRGNYCTLNPLAAGATTALSNGNLHYVGGAAQQTLGTIGMSSGKWYWEDHKISGTYGATGIALADAPLNNHPGQGNSWAYNKSGQKWHNGSATNYGASWDSGDTIGVAFDADAGTLSFYKNGVSQGVAFTGLTNGPYFVTGADNSVTGYFNFGQRGFQYTNAGTNRPSADYKPLTTSFLPEPTIKRGDEAMDVALWTGNNSIQQISGFRISPDLVWIKNRDSGSYGHRIVDSVRGATYRLQPHANSAQGQETTGLTAFNNDGFTIGAAQDYNLSANNHVGWMWDAGEVTTTIAAGGSNSLAYDQSQTWSNSLSATFRGSEPATNAFDGDTSTIAGSAGSITYTSPVAVASSATIRVFVHGGDHDVSVNSGANQTVAAGSFVTLNFTNPTNNTFTITFDRVASGADTGVRAIEIGGKLLVDNGVSVTNVPEVECKVRANQAAGFSIVKVDSPTNTQTRVHGLSKAPEFFICKSTGSADSWHTYWAELGKDYYINIYPIGAKSASDQFGSQEPNSVSFYVKPNTGSGANKSGGMIYYLWHSVEGFSKFSSYTGTGGDVFVYCGFRPRLITFKNADQSNNWLTYDTARDPSNVANRSIQWDYSYNDSGITNDNIDILSNGFMIKATRNDLTGNGNKILFGAWAEHPFASNARAR